MKYYVTHYKEYPIHDPAEGGYYYAGVEAIEHEGEFTLKEARKRLKEICGEEKMEMWGLNRCIRKSKYIGEDEYYVIERKDRLGNENRGEEVYQ